MQQSLWLKNEQLPRFPKLEADISAEVLIIGGGLAGILCAQALAEAGADCVLIEAGRLCGGTSGHTTAKLTSQHGCIYDRLLREFGEGAARSYYDANEAALAAFRRLGEKYDCNFETADNYIYAAEVSKKLEREFDALKRLKIPAEFVRETELPFPVSGAIRFRNQGRFHPLKLVPHLAEGLRIYENTPARQFLGSLVTTPCGSVTAKHIIVTTHFPILNKHGSYFVKMYQQRSYVLALENAPAMDGMYLDAAENGLSCRSWQGLLLLGGGGHRTGKQGGGWAELERFARAHYPNAREVCRWAAQDCMTLDGMPYIGRYSAGTPNLYVVTGFHKWGMTSSMVSAMVLRDMILGKRNPYQELFSPSRSILRPQLFINAAESAWNLLTPTRPRCPHLGCALKWNPQEHSWDCPCHGSRFDEQGGLLDGPATGDLKK